jgi:hypothetical protein
VDTFKDLSYLQFFLLLKKVPSRSAMPWRQINISPSLRFQPHGKGLQVPLSANGGATLPGLRIPALVTISLLCTSVWKDNEADKMLNMCVCTGPKYYKATRSSLCILLVRGSPKK